MDDLTSVLFKNFDKSIDQKRSARISGTVVRFDGLTAHCDGFPARVGSICEISTGNSSVLAEVISFKDGLNQLVVFDLGAGIRCGDKVTLVEEGQNISIDNRTSFELSNGSQIKASSTSADAGRSEALSLLIVDEAAFVRNFDELWMGLYPTLSTGGRAIVLSTPNGVGGQYYDLWMQAESGENVFNAIKLPWDVHPDRDDAWFLEETRNMSKKQMGYHRCNKKIN